VSGVSDFGFKGRVQGSAFRGSGFYYFLIPECLNASIFLQAFSDTRHLTPETFCTRHLKPFAAFCGAIGFSVFANML
jgi:hypothetical protein